MEHTALPTYVKMDRVCQFVPDLLLKDDSPNESPGYSTLFYQNINVKLLPTTFEVPD